MIRRFWDFLKVNKGRAFIAFIAGAIGVYSGFLSFQPKVSIVVEEAGDTAREFDPDIIVTNDGQTTIYDTTFNCADIGVYARSPEAFWPEDYQRTRPKFEGIEFGDIGILYAGQKAKRRCQIRPGPEGFSRKEGSQLMVFVRYKSWLTFGESMRAVGFESHSNGEAVHWRFDQEGLTPEQAKALDKTGAQFESMENMHSRYGDLEQSSNFAR